MMYIVPIVIILFGLLLIYIVFLIIGKTSDFFSSIKYYKNPKNIERTKGLTDQEKIDKLIGSILGTKIQQTRSYDELWEIAAQFGDYMSENKSIFPGIYPTSALPYSKEEIKTALATLLILDNNETAKELASMHYLFLDDFAEDEIYNPLEVTFGKLNYQNTSNLSDEMIRNMAGKHDLVTNWFKIKQTRTDNTLNELIKLRMLAGLEVDGFANQLRELRNKSI